jgi:hypothetical protein
MAPIRLPVVLLAFAAGAFATSSTSTSAAPASSATGSSSSTTVDTSGEYSLTADPAVLTAVPCVQNCLSPYQMDDPTNCDDVTNNCACLSAPAGVLSVIEGCIATVCTVSASVDAYSSSAQNLYTSYCKAHYNAAQLSSAASAEASSNSAAAAASSTESAGSSSSGMSGMTITGSSTGSSKGTSTATGSGSASGSAASTSKSGAVATPAAVE